MKPGEDHIGVGVGALILNENNQIFLAKRGPKTRNEQGAWECPGGELDYGESMETAIVREIQEEFGITISVESQLGAFDHILPDAGQHWVSVTFVCRLASGVPEILEPEKCAAIGWFDGNNLPTPLSSITQENLSQYLNSNP